LEFRRDAQGSLEELRGSEARPLIQPVRFDGKPYFVDGSKNTIIRKQIDKNHFERIISENGKLLTTRRIQISDDAKGRGGSPGPTRQQHVRSKRPIANRPQIGNRPHVTSG
jgi:hypothetical protein